MVRAACFERTRVTKILPTPVTIEPCVPCRGPRPAPILRLRTSQISQDSVVQLYASEPISRGEVASGQWAPEALWWGVENPHTVSVVYEIENGRERRTGTLSGGERGGRLCAPRRVKGKTVLLIGVLVGEPVSPSRPLHAGGAPRANAGCGWSVNTVLGASSFRSRPTCPLLRLTPLPRLDARCDRRFHHEIWRALPGTHNARGLDRAVRAARASR